MTGQQQNIKQFDQVYFLGIGGVGMSALARYFNLMGKKVSGYDKTKTHLTSQLEKEGIEIHYNDLGEDIPKTFKNKENTLIVFTPAIPEEHGELSFFKKEKFIILKRAQVLGLITQELQGIGVAGTHGKTTTSTLLAHILQSSSWKCNAFLGGISSNYNTNFIYDENSSWVIVEADEFDQSFLHLSPYAGIVTSTDADHLDIYGNEDYLKENFQKYVELIPEENLLIRHIDAEVSHPNQITYGFEKKADYIAKNIRFKLGTFLFDIQTPQGVITDIELGIPGIHNAENATACIALALELGLNEAEIKKACKTFKGVKRRFEYHIKTNEIVYIDDYAHHPTEIDALISSIRLLYPQQKIVGIFQPHLYSRTKDFFNDFAKQLSRLDEVIILPIYPAREKPIEGVTSQRLLEIITLENKRFIPLNKIVKNIKPEKNTVYLTIGAGDIDRIVQPLIEKLSSEK